MFLLEDLTDYKYRVFCPYVWCIRIAMQGAKHTSSKGWRQEFVLEAIVKLRK